MEGDMPVTEAVYLSMGLILCIAGFCTAISVRSAKEARARKVRAR